jgi:hypothetical protein
VVFMAWSGCWYSRRGSAHGWRWTNRHWYRRRGMGRRLVEDGDRFCNCSLILPTSVTSWTQWWQTSVGAVCCGWGMGGMIGRCSAAWSLLISASKSLTLSVRTWDLVDKSCSWESFNASSSLHMFRARWESSRSRLAGVSAGPDLPNWFL